MRVNLLIWFDPSTSPLPPKPFWTMLKKLHFCYGRASLLKYHESQIWFWICGDQVFECLGEGTVQVLWLSSLGAFIAGHGRGWINDLLYQCLGSGNAKKQNLNWNATLNWWQGLLNVQKNSRSVEYCHFSEICLASGSDWLILWSAEFRLNSTFLRLGLP